MNVVIVGAGGHGQVVADLMDRARGAAGVAMGFVDDARSCGASIGGLPILGPLAMLPAIPHDAVVIAIGNNQTRLRLVGRLERAGERLLTVIHPSATIASDVSIADGSMICAGAIVGTGSVIGKAVIVNTASTIDHHNRLADGVHIAPGVHMGGEVSVGMGALVGIAAVILPRTRIGDYAVVGAGSVVTRDVPQGLTVVGTPARVVEAHAR